MFIKILISTLLIFSIINTRFICMASYNVEVVKASPFSTLGEGPHWDVESQSLYYVDIYGKEASILRYSPKEDKVYTAKIDGEPVVSFIIPVKGTTDQFAVGIGRRVGIVQWDGTSSKAKLLRIATEVEQSKEYELNRFNDAKADPTGRFYGGTMRKEECEGFWGATDGSLYKFRKGERIENVKGGVGVSNGLTWQESSKKFYYIDSCEQDVKEFDWDPRTGNIYNEKVLISFKDESGVRTWVPDGMTSDADGNLYVATWGGSKIIKVNPKGEIVLEIKFPVAQVTSAAFGGPKLDILYVTTAGTDRDGPQAPNAGSLFKVTGLGVKGIPMAAADV